MHLEARKVKAGARQYNKMSGGEIESPYAIATLAKPLDSKHGRTRIAAVHGIRGSRKRKRHEVAVGVDGEGVNVYNVCGSSMLCVYPLD